MGLFDKKFCDVCGEKIGMLGNRKLEDGNLCKDCAKKLSPWFDDRRHSTLEEIKSQPEMQYKENENGSWRSMRGDWYSLEVESVKEDEIVVVKKRTGGPLDANYDRCVINKVDGKWTITSEKTILVS